MKCNPIRLSRTTIRLSITTIHLSRITIRLCSAKEELLISMCIVTELHGIKVYLVLHNFVRNALEF